MQQEITLCKLMKTAANEMGLRTKKGEKLPNLKSIDFKKSLLLWNDGTKYGLVEHYYEPLISQTLFSKCQDVMNGFHKKPHKTAIKPFIFERTDHLF